MDMAESTGASRFDRVVDAGRLSNAMERALAHGEGRAVVLIELQEVEDPVVAAAEARIVRTVRPSDMIGRLRRDRFAILAPTRGGLEHAQRLADRLSDRLGEPFHVGGKQVKLAARIGVAVGEGPADTAEKVLRRAEDAFSPR